MTGAVEASVAYLGSAEAAASLARDPYWPKWDSPWWHMTLLWELGRADRIPEAAARGMLAALKSRYLPFFPLRLEEVPAGVDPVSGVMCHCGLGTMFQVLTACGLDMDAELPWARGWFLRYQLPDGGLNCDEAAYLKPAPKSSPLSTLPPLEAVLFCTPRPFTPEETAFLDRGADYLINHRLVRRASGDGGVIDPAWLEVAFPRFYDYDLLRGLRFLAAYSKARGREVPKAAVSESLSLLEACRSDGRIAARRVGCAGATNPVFGADGLRTAERTPASGFPLLREAAHLGTPLLSAHASAVRTELGT